MLKPLYKDTHNTSHLTSEKITSKKVEEPKQETICTLFCELCKSFPYAFKCWFDRVNSIKKPKYYLPSEYTKTLEELIDIFNKSHSKNKKKNVNDRIERIALTNIKNVKTETDAKALQNLINKISTNVTIGENLKDFLIQSLNEHCEKNSISVNISCSSPRRKASFFLNQGTFKQ